MSPSTAKKVLLERFDRTAIRGYVHPQTCLQAENIEIMMMDGSVVLVPYTQVKALCFVRDHDGPSILGERKEFLARPKSQGLWVEVRFRDGDRMEAMMPNNLLEAGFAGYLLSPPEAAGNSQRVFVPRAAVREVAVLGVVGPPKRPSHARRHAENRQIRLFGEDAAN